MSNCLHDMLFNRADRYAQMGCNGRITHFLETMKHEGLPRSLGKIPQRTDDLRQPLLAFKDTCRGDFLNGMVKFLKRDMRIALARRLAPPTVGQHGTRNLHCIALGRSDRHRALPLMKPQRDFLHHVLGILLPNTAREEIVHQPEYGISAIHITRTSDIHTKPHDCPRCLPGIHP